MEGVIEKEDKVYKKRQYKFDFKNYHKKTLDLLKGKKGKLLELGPGDGSFLKILKKDFDVTGIDIVPKNIQACKKKGIKITKQDLNKNFKFKSNGFEVVIALEVIEHLFNYENAVKEVARVLKDNGIFIISVPNSCYWRYRLSVIFGKVPEELSGNEGHVVHLSLNQWEKLLKKHFKVVKNYATERVVSNIKILPKNYFARYAFFECIK